MNSPLTQGSLSSMEVNVPPTGLSHLDTSALNHHLTMHRRRISRVSTVALLSFFGVSLAHATNCSITSFGAKADGVTNNAAAIQNTFNYAAANKCTALIPAGTFAYRGTLTAKGIAVTGTGAGS